MLRVRADVIIRYLITDETVKAQKLISVTGWLYRTIQTVFNQNKDYIHSRWPRGLRRVSAACRLLGLRVRTLPGTWMSLSCECCQVEVSATGRSLVQRSPTECVWV
jgi:hypothetical protein